MNHGLISHVLCTVSATVGLCYDSVAQHENYAAFVFDTSASMSNFTRPITGNTRCVDALAEARLLANAFVDRTDDLAAIVSFGPSVVVEQTWTSDPTPITNTFDRLSTNGCTGSCTPLSSAICKAVEMLEAVTTTGNLSLWVFSDGEANCGYTNNCFTLQNATSGCKCPMDTNAGSCTTDFSDGWQLTACNRLSTGTIIFNAYSFGRFSTEMSPPPFLQAASSLTGGAFFAIDDQSSALPGLAWETRGRGCTSNGRLLSMTYAGNPTPGSTVEIGTRVTFPTPFTLFIGFTEIAVDLTPLGAPGCTLYTTIEAQLPSPFFGLPVSLAIPNDPALSGTSVFFQGAQQSVNSNALGVAVSNLLEMRIQ